MNSTTTNFEKANAPLALILGAVRDGQWNEPSACEGWTNRDVVRHLIETQREFLSGNGIDLGEMPDVDSDPTSAWVDHSNAVLAKVADDAVAETKFDGHFGPSTIGDTLVQFYVWDMVAHRWDVATGTGQDPQFAETELDQLESGIAGFGGALYMEGICKSGVTAPANADRLAHILAKLGRQA